jgi:hypothetical protein
MDPEESWDEVVEKLKAWVSAPAVLPIADANDSTVSELYDEAEKADWLNICKTVALIRHKLEVIQFDAQETLIKACASGEVWSRFVFPNESEMVFCFIDPRWWQTDLAGIKIPHGLRNDNGFEVTADEVDQFFIHISGLLLWLTNRGWLAKRGQLQWNPVLGNYGPITSERIANSKKTKGDVSVPLANNTDDISSRPLRLASDSMIDKVINDTYTEADHAGLKPPNVKEIVAPVQKRLRAKGYQASGRQIQRLAEADRYKNRRRKPGATVTSANRQQKTDF